MPIKTAKAILDQHWDGILPVKVSVIAERMGIKTEMVSPLSSHGLGQASGEIRLESNGSAVMRINSKEAQVRQRFTAAHEIGHFALGHLNSQSQTMLRDTSSQFNMGAAPQERDANQFAAELLMPADAIYFVLENGYAKNLQELAALFGVSQAAMQFRIDKLEVF